jgi:hypothetical protein
MEIAIASPVDVTGREQVVDPFGPLATKDAARVLAEDASPYRIGILESSIFTSMSAGRHMRDGDLGE